MMMIANMGLNWGTMKNAAGIYGILAAGAIFLEPFLKIAAHYLSLKVTGSLCAALSDADRAQVFGQTAIRFYDLIAKEQRP